MEKKLLNHIITVFKLGLTDVAGRALAEDYTADFHVLTGDVDGNRVTNDLDLYWVWQNQLKPARRRDANEDLTGNGKVDRGDLLVVMMNYLDALPGASEAPTRSTRSTPVRMGYVSGAAAPAGAPDAAALEPLRYYVILFPGQGPGGFTWAGGSDTGAVCIFFTVRLELQRLQLPDDEVSLELLNDERL